jgi:hypothetical protein
VELAALTVEQAIEVVRSMIAKPSATTAANPGETAPSKDGR